MFGNRIFSFASRDMAVDLGTSNTLIYLRGIGIALNEPSVVAIETIDGAQRVIAVGADAKLMLGKTPKNITTVRPLRDGVIADLHVAELMLHHFIGKVLGKRHRLARWPEIVMCLPSGATSVEGRAIRDAASNAGASKVFLLPEPMAAAVGADMPVTEPVGGMIVDIGGGTTEVAVISLGGLAYSKSVRVGGDKMDEAIVSTVRRNHGLLIGEATAERIKKDIGAAVKFPGTDDTIIEIGGRDVATGAPTKMSIKQAEIVDALADPVKRIVDAVLLCLENTPPELAADMIDQGIVLSGGGALLSGIDNALGKATGLKVMIANDPLTCVVTGAGRTLEDIRYRDALTHQ